MQTTLQAPTGHSHGAEADAWSAPDDGPSSSAHAGRNEGRSGLDPAWLDFLDEYLKAIERAERSDLTTPPVPGARLFEAARRIPTSTGRTIACSMVSQLIQLLATDPGPAGIDGRVRMALDYVVQRLSDESCRLDDVAQDLRVSSSYLGRLICQQTGVTFSQHLRLARMSKAARLLEQVNLSVKEISAGTGYAHAPSFVRQFKRHFKMTPGDFRRRARTLKIAATPCATP